MQQSYKSIISDPKECLFCGIPPYSKDKVISLCEDCWNIWNDAYQPKQEGGSTDGKND